MQGNYILNRLLPLIVLLGGLLIAGLLILVGPDVQPRISESVAPLVRVAIAEPQTHQFSVHTHGSVVPRTESDIVVEVDGRIITMSPSLVSGGFFTKGDVLLEIDPLDYQAELEQAQAKLSRGESDLENERKGHLRIDSLHSRGAVSNAQRDNALNSLKIAEATLREAKASLSRAERNLARTQIIAPYDGRVRSENVDIGQFVRRGDEIGTIYATDFVEVRLPIHDEELAYLDIPLGRTGQDPVAQLSVTLTAKFAGEWHQWQGYVVRTEGELDPNTRMMHVVARVANPYGDANKGAPLSIGLFVDAEIHGRIVPNVTVLPRSALRADDKLLLVDNSNKLRFREVEVLRLAGSNVYIGNGVSTGDRVCLSPMQSSADGMLVRVSDQPSISSQQSVVTDL
jgi:RND family efflux transporter MFP subunit